MNRRAFLERTAMGVAASGVALLGLLAVRRRRPDALTLEQQRRGLIRPPGAVDEDEFLARCIRCQRCSEVCEGDAIDLFGPGTGVHEGTPFMVPERSACTLCLECGKACPTGALLPLDDKKDARIGVAVVDEHLCVSHNGSGICGACFTACPLRGKAITQGMHNR
ncbi:MAG: 4Fe-4S dicluster domain-containing protein, partial [Planctomycetota bacterium]